MTIEEVKGILGAKFQGLEGAIIDWQAGKLVRQCKAIEEAERAVEELELQKLVEGYADYRATQASQSAVANYKREQVGAGGADNKDEKPAKEVKTEQVADTPEWVRTLLEQNKTLVERLNALEESKVRATRGARFGKLLEGVPETFRKAYERLPVEGYTDEEFEALCKEVQSEVSSLKTELTARGGRVGFPPVGSGAETTKELPAKDEAEAFLQKMNIKSKKED